MKKSDTYSTNGAKDAVDEMGSITQKLAQDLRKHIRSLGAYPILSSGWCEMAEVFGRIANISDMESKLSASKNDATLWETEEQALRYLIEDGKLNLCLRNMIAYKQFQRGLLNASPAEREAYQERSTECIQFERGLGVVLRNAWSHVEALQTTDLTGLLNHIADVFESALDDPASIESYAKAGNLHQRQEIMAYFYMRGLLRHLEDVTEGRVMPLIRERGLFMLGVRVLQLTHESLLKENVVVAAECMALFVETEDFDTHRQAYVTSAKDSGALEELKESCLKPLMTDIDVRRLVRPLSDCADRSKRMYPANVPRSPAGGAGRRPMSAALANYSRK